MKNNPIHQEKNLYPGSNIKIPKWLKGPVPKGRNELEIDNVEDGEGTALDLLGGSSKIYQNFKRAKRRLKEMEELHEWSEKKADKDPEGTGEFLEGMDRALNSMVE